MARWAAGSLSLKSVGRRGVGGRDVNGYLGPEFTTQFQVVECPKYYPNYQIPTTYGLWMLTKSSIEK